MRYTRDLEESGFTKEQANTALNVVLEIMNDNFATSKDIQLSELALRSDMERMETSILSDMKEMGAAIRSEMKEMETSIRSEMKEMETSLRGDIKNIQSDLESLPDKLTIRLTRNVVVIVGVIVAAQTVILRL